MFVFDCKINTFCQHFKKNTNISFLLFVEHFKFIEAYHILLTICKAESTFMIQIVRLQKIIKILYLFSCIFQQIVVPLQPKSNK